MAQQGWAAGGARTAVVADVGRGTIKIGLTDDRGVLRHDSVRVYEPTAQPTVSGAISSFARDAGLSDLPPRLAVAVSGNPRGDTVTVTNGRWRVSKSGLAAMTQAQPLILNDFAANAWAISAPGGAGRLETLGGAGVRPQEAGTFCIIGVGSGLGVALLSRDNYGAVNVVATEAGHAAFPSGMKDAEPLTAEIGARQGLATSEMLISGSGLVAIYGAVAKRHGGKPVADTPKEIVRLGTSARDPMAGEALTLLVRALWHFAGNMVLTYGAWDGVILTGSLAAALRPLLQRGDLAQEFVLPGPYKRELAATPRSLGSFRHAELEGAAAALLVDDDRRAFSQHLRAA